jgi:hypothetical protein
MMNPVIQKFSGHKILFLLSVIFLLSCNIKKNAMSDKVNGERDISVAVKLLEIDNLGNIYVLDIDNKLTKHNQEGKLLFEHYDKQLGIVDAIDVSNPLQILMYYKDYGHVKYLDNTLAPIQTIDLNSDKYFGMETVCQSNDNHIWVVDPTIQRIIKLDKNLNSIFETNNFGDLGLPDGNFIKMRENGNYLVALHKTQGFIVFDNFGQFIKKIPSYGALDFQFDGKALIYKTMTSYRYQKIKFPDFAFISPPISINQSQLKVARKYKEAWIAGYSGGVDIIKH